MPSWHPSISLQTLQERAVLLEKIRRFFTARGVLEVETPLLSHATVSDPHVLGIPAIFKKIGTSEEKMMYLQTSPEYAMKRLLAAGAGAIYQISKAFRQGEIGKNHNPEFTMLEWYRPGFDHHQLMDEMDALLQLILNVGAAERVSYAEAFEKRLGLNPHHASVVELIACAASNHIHFPVSNDEDKNVWLDLLLTHCIEPELGRQVPTFLYDFPITQAALAKIRYDESPPTASRFEVYFKGVELANGFHELQDAAEQRKRFEQDLKNRASLGLTSVPIDEFFLAALEQGIPDCAGVALGVDRLMMLAMQKKSVSDVISFGFERA